MGAREVGFANGGIVWMRFRYDDEKDRLEATEVDGRKWYLDCTQAHLLMLHLQEHLSK
jgi:hypothetical protein